MSGIQQPSAELTWRDWAPDGTVALTVLLVGLVEIARRHTDVQHSVVLVLGIAVAAGLSRRAPAAALTLTWVMFGYQLLGDVPILLTEFAVAVVAFGTARWGHPVTAWIAALSMPVAAFVAISGDNYDRFRSAADYPGLSLTYSLANPLVFGAIIAATLALAAPFLAGLVFRYVDHAHRSQVGQVAAEADAAAAIQVSEQSQEIARLRDQQAKLARDVHDVVGHSLAVILAQAESGQFLPNDDPAKLKATLATIATSARSSLQDVRAVLATEAPPVAKPHGLDSLVENVRAAGQEVVSSEVGTPQPMPPELDVVAFRVLQEMLTNAMKHGRRDHPVIVERHWPDGSFADHDLRIEVRNASGEPPPSDLTQPIGGQGLAGMQRRLESVGGRIDVRRRQEADGPTFTATAWVPVRRSA